MNQYYRRKREKSLFNKQHKLRKEMGGYVSSKEKGKTEKPNDVGVKKGRRGAGVTLVGEKKASLC